MILVKVKESLINLFFRGKFSSWFLSQFNIFECSKAKLKCQTWCYIFYVTWPKSAIWSSFQNWGHEKVTIYVIFQIILTFSALFVRWFVCYRSRKEISDFKSRFNNRLFLLSQPPQFLIIWPQMTQGYFIILWIISRNDLDMISWWLKRY